MPQFFKTLWNPYNLFIWIGKEVKNILRTNITFERYTVNGFYLQGNTKYYHFWQSHLDLYLCK